MPDASVVDRFKAWLEERGIEVMRRRIGLDGLVTLRLRGAFGAPFEVDFYPDDLEADPENAIESVRSYLAKRPIRL